MNIEEGKVVTLTYTLTNPEGQELDSATKTEPFVYLHGMGQMIPGLERELEGKKAGHKGSYTIPPEDAYGDINPDLRLKIEKTNFPKNQTLEPGMQFVAQVGENHMPFTVHKVEADFVYVDGNHPLAGMTLKFDLEVVEVRTATEEELEHGHAHGPGGHHH